MTRVPLDQLRAPSSSYFYMAQVNPMIQQKWLPIVKNIFAFAQACYLLVLADKNIQHMCVYFFNFSRAEQYFY